MCINHFFADFFYDKQKNLRKKCFDVIQSCLKGIVDKKENSCSIV
jgi:hypothetical protein